MATVGRRKRKRRPGAGTNVKIKAHSRSPRGSNAGKPRVKVDASRRGLPARTKPRKKNSSR